MTEGDVAGVATNVPKPTAAATQQNKVEPYMHEDDRSSLSSDDTQIGVKNIEAISQTWTKWSLFSAYLG